MVSLGYDEYGGSGFARDRPQLDSHRVFSQFTKAETGVTPYVDILRSARDYLLNACAQIGLYTANKYGHKHVKAWHSNMPLYVSLRPHCRLSI